ncbi:hypothetical protein [Streptomyces sp. MUM 16J]|uniref:hypothetical protein n=1 Tax=Streptomyces sp. MUM 16J TaxID=2791988 RepID=UPI001F044D34|nr:hypothetical protein [Streptomyces sp. MUM 16J]MCH0560659.1 hypothetical protein [Streptomyces sp. MUM 16J]
MPETSGQEPRAPGHQAAVHLTRECPRLPFLGGRLTHRLLHGDPRTVVLARHDVTVT